jgi:hypothetical protein
MGTGSKVALVILRISEFISSVIVMSVIARFIHQINQAGADSNSRIIYTIVVACISTVYSLVFVAPLPYAFMAFPLDFVMFVLWLVVFCLDETLSGTNTCSSVWFNNYWSFFWGGFYFDVDDGVIISTNSGCGAWRSVLAFSFVAFMLFLLSTGLGGYVIAEGRHAEKDRKAFGPRGGPVGGPADREKPGPIDGPLVTGASGASAAPLQEHPQTHTQEHPQEFLQQPVSGGTV